MSKTIILPSCDDRNRGDQALVWQTREIAKRAGLADECLMLANDPEGSEQSKAEGIGVLSPILLHPSAKSSVNSHVGYGAKTMLVWGLILLSDSLRSLLLLTRFGRKVVRPFLSAEEVRTIEEISTSDACFVKGGGFLHSTNSITDPFRAFFFLYHIMLAQSLKVPVFVLPNSFGPFNDPFYRFLVRRVLSKCNLVTARESISQEVLTLLGVECYQFPDLAFGLESAVNEAFYLAEAVEGNENRPIVGITARPYRFPGSMNPEQDYENYVKELAKLADWFYGNGYFPVLIEHVISKGAHESDLTAIKDVAKLLKSGKYGLFSDPTLTAREMKKLYSECDFVIGTRFHSVIFSLAEHVPALAIAYGGNKGTGIMKDLGFSDYAIPIEDFSAEQAIAIFSRIEDDASYEKYLDTLNDDMAEKYRNLVDLINAKMGK